MIDAADGRTVHNLVSRLMGVARKDPFYKLDPDFPLPALAEILGRRGLDAARGAMLKARVSRVDMPCFVGREVKIIGGRQVRMGRGCALHDYVLVDAVSRRGVSIGVGVTLDRFVLVKCTGTLRELGEGVTIGDYSSLGAFCFVGGTGGVSIGRNVLGGQRLSFHPENHVFQDSEVPIREQGTTRRGIVVEDDCWLGSGAIFLDGVTVGRGSVIAAGSVVNTDIPPFSVAGGVPARVLRLRPDNAETGKPTTRGGMHE
ncbi:MAG: transferase [Actinobacteria bacterium]|nr:MAG: transferase [Actinomycetota bacterium]